MLWQRIKTYVYFLRSMLRVNSGLLRGMWKLTRLPQPAITVFGGSRLPKEDIHSKKICTLAEKLAHAGFSIITGGGPGIMEAANLGAMTHVKENGKKKIPSKLTTIGISLSKLQEANEYTQEYIIQPYFFTRKWLLVRYAVGFVVEPGGFGTLDELSEVLTLIQTHRMPKTPVILIGVEYWKPLLEWVHERALKNGLLEKKDADLLHVTDNVDEAFEIINTTCAGCKETGIAAKSTEKRNNNNSNS